MSIPVISRVISCYERDEGRRTGDAQNGGRECVSHVLRHVALSRMPSPCRGCRRPMLVSSGGTIGGVAVR